MLGIQLPVSGFDIWQFYSEFVVYLGPLITTMFGIQLVLEIVFLALRWFKGQV